MERSGRKGEGKPPVVVLTGPTASGKSGLGIELALRLGGEIINADSMQVYRFMDIGTAKPSPEDRARVPHHLFDVVSPDGDYSAGRYAADARVAAQEIHDRGRLVVLVGGTGLYIRAFLAGMVTAGGADRELRDRLEREHAAAVAAGDPERLYRRLTEWDPKAAEGIHPNDLRRVIRALEICTSSGRTASSLRGAHAFEDQPYRVLHLALDPGVEVLDARIDARCKQMIDAGLLREVRRLRDAGYGPELRPMKAIGYRHINPVVDGIETLAGALAEMQRDTRRFARRQRTWLRTVRDVQVADPAEASVVLRTAEAFLSSAEDRAS